MIDDVQVQYDAVDDDFYDADFEPLPPEHARQHIQFQGVNFDLDVSRTTPVKVLD